jgi:hypothetical protein
MKFNQIRWYWHRLLAMEPGEVMLRCRRWWQTRLISGKPIAVTPCSLLQASAEDERVLPLRDAATDGLREQTGDLAQRVRRGQWTLFGWHQTAVSTSPDWSLDPLSGNQAPLHEPAHQLNHRALESGADPRAVWEINRWTELTVLAQNAWLNHHLDDAHLVQDWLCDWLEHNPPNTGINWTSALEAAIRLIHFTWIDRLLTHSGDPQILRRQSEICRDLLPPHVAYVWQHRSIGSSANNHLLGELSGLIHAARRWPCLSAWCCPGEQLSADLEQEILRQFSVDGGNQEQALHYHWFAWHLCFLVKRCGITFSAAAEERLAAGASFFLNLTAEREPWHFGDNDDALLFPLPTGGQSYEAECCAWLRGEQPESALPFWLGPAPECELKPSGHWHLYQQSGYAIWRDERCFLRLDGSPLGFGKMAAHGHLDALHLSFWLNDLAVIVDPGTGAYYNNAELRQSLAAAEAHNGPRLLQEAFLPKRIGTFLWAQTHDRLAIHTDARQVEARWDLNEVQLCRVVSIQDAGISVRDVCSQDQCCQARWTLAPDWSVTQDSSHRFSFVHGNGEKLVLELDGEVQEVSLERVPVSPHYGQVCSATAISIEFKNSLESHFKML